jgi:hypothetical protein
VLKNLHGKMGFFSRNALCFSPSASKNKWNSITSATTDGDFAFAVEDLLFSFLTHFIHLLEVKRRWNLKKIGNIHEKKNNNYRRLQPVGKHLFYNIHHSVWLCFAFCI